MTDLLDVGWVPAQARILLPVLLDLTLKGVLLLALAGLITTTFKALSASTRHLVWCLAVCSVLALPVLSLTLPAWQVAAISDIPYLDEVASSLHSEQPEASAPVAGPDDTSGTVTATTSLSAADMLQRHAVPFYEPYLDALLRLFSAMQAAHWSVWLLTLWIVGVVAVVLRFSIGAAGVAWLAYRARPIHDPEWTDLVEDISKRIGLKRPVTLLRSTRTAMPMTWGVWRSVVLLPVSANDWSEARRRCVMTHELAHVKRWDCLTQTLAQIASAISWFNPLVWIAAREMREEREKACDDMVLNGGIRPSHYAAHLLDIARTTRTTLLMPLGAVSMARPSQLESRVLSILDRDKRRSRLGTLSTGAGMALTALLLLPLAALRPGTYPANVLAFERIETEQGEAFRWRGTMEEGQTLSVRGARGTVQATPSKNNHVEVVALTKGSGTRVQILEEAKGLVVCLPNPTDPSLCAQEDDASAVDFLVHVPSGVRFSGSTISGDVNVVALRSDVDATTTTGDIFAQTTGIVRVATVDGDVDMRTTNFGQATSVSGDIHARIGKTVWEGTLPFSSVNGDIIVELPEETHTDIDLQVEANGRLKTALPLSHDSETDGERFSGTFGQGGRHLSLHTVDGNITVTYAGTEPVRAQKVFAVRPQHRAEPSSPTYFAKAEHKAQKESVRIQAIHTLLATESSDAVAKLSEVLLHDESEAVRSEAALALGAFGCSEAVPALVAALADGSEHVRRSVITSLEELEYTRALPALARALKTESSGDLRRQLVGLLAQADDERAVASLRLARQDRNADVRQAAEEVLQGTYEIVIVTLKSKKKVATAEPMISRLEFEGGMKMAIAGSFVDKARRALAEWHLELGLDDEDMQVLLTNLGDQNPFAMEMRQLGFKDATDEELLVARLFGLDGSYVNSIRDAGYCPSLGELVQLKTAGIDRAFLKKLEKEGRTELSVGQLVALRQGEHGPATSSRIIEIEASLPPQPSQPVQEFGVSRGPNPGHTNK